jgi:hypothetical protein
MLHYSTKSSYDNRIFTTPHHPVQLTDLYIDSHERPSSMLGRDHLLAFMVYPCINFISEHFLLSPHEFGIRSIWKYYDTE